MKLNKKGFTLAELLIVIAIIAILIAIAIPVFSGQLDSAKLQTDHSNLRSAYAIVQSNNILGEKMDTTTVYQTDGTFGSGKDVTIKATQHDGADGTDGTASCVTCVVDCKGYKAGDTIGIEGLKADGSVTTTAAEIVSYRIIVKHS